MITISVGSAKDVKAATSQEYRSSGINGVGRNWNRFDKLGQRCTTSALQTGQA